MGSNSNMESAQIYSLISDTAVQRNLSALRFLSRIKRNEKINTRELFVRDNDNVLQRVLRTIKNFTIYVSTGEVGESKELTLEYIRTIIDESINLIAGYNAEGDEFKRSIADIISKNLESSKRGIHHLIETYSSDRKFIAEAEAVLLTLDARVSSMIKRGYITSVSEISFMPVLNEST